MFSKPTETKPRTGRKMVIAALVGVAAVCAAAMYGQSYESPVYTTGVEHHQQMFETLVDHRDYHADAQNWTDELIQEAENNMQHQLDAIVMLKAKTDGRVSIKNGIKVLEEGVKTADKGIVKAVEPKKIQHAFKVSKFNAELAGVYPNESAQINSLKNKMKSHHLDLSNLIKDGELVASSTQTNLKRTQRVLELRDKYKVAKQLDAKKETLLWTMEIKRLISDIEYAHGQVQTLVGVLKDLQKNCLDTQNKLEAVLERVKGNIASKMGNAQKEIKKIEAELAAVRCTWWGFWFWRHLNCNVANATRQRLNVIRAAHQHDFDIAKSMNDRMEYFKALTHVAAMLTDEASKELDSQKTFENTLKDTMKALKESQETFDLLKEMAELSEPGEDNIALDHFAEEIEEIQNTLMNECSRVIRDATLRKEQLRQAIIWGDL